MFNLVTYSRNIILTSDPVLIETKSGQQMQYLSYDFYPRNNYIYFNLDDVCKENTNYTLTFPAFKGDLNDDLQGFYRVDYTDGNGNKK